MRSLPQPVSIFSHEFKSATEVFEFLRYGKRVFGITEDRTPIVVRWPETDNAQVIFAVRNEVAGEITYTYTVYEVLS